MSELLDNVVALRPFANQPWRVHAACYGVDKALMFPTAGESLREARKVCAGSPVRTQCLKYALDAGERFGVWGGKSEKERRQMRRRLVRAS